MPRKSVLIVSGDLTGVMPVAIRFFKLFGSTSLINHAGPFWSSLGSASDYTKRRASEHTV